MPIRAIDHVQLAMPPGGEDHATAFYQGLLGLTRTPKPAELAARGGCWFGEGEVRVHLGVEEGFTPARKAHPAFLVTDLDAMIERLGAAGHDIREETGLEGYRQRYVDDPFGNRIELLEPLEEGGA